MVKRSEIFRGDPLISRVVYNARAAAYTVTAPPGANFVRVSMVGGGAIHGAAFARRKSTCTGGELFTLKVGLRKMIGGGSEAEDSVFTRNTGSVILCRADAATDLIPGDAANCIGDVTRSGSSAPGVYEGGAAAGDDADPYPLGYGGPGSFDNRVPGNPNRSPVPGAGGRIVDAGRDFSGNVVQNEIKPGDGRATVEFFASDPGYS